MLVSLEYFGDNEIEFCSETVGVFREEDLVILEETAHKIRLSTTIDVKVSISKE